MVEAVTTSLPASEPWALALFRRSVLKQRKHAEIAQHEAEERLRSIFENCVEGIFQTTPDGRYLSLNPALARMTGYASPAEKQAAVHDIAGQEFVDPTRRAEQQRLSLIHI